MYLELSQSGICNVLVCGVGWRIGIITSLDGWVWHPCSATLGWEVVSKINEIRADLCILGVNGFNQDGVSDSDYEVVQVKKAMIKASKQIIAPIISEKLNSTLRLQVASSDEVDYLITELSPEHKILESYQSKVGFIL